MTDRYFITRGDEQYTMTDIVNLQRLTRQYL